MSLISNTWKQFPAGSNDNLFHTAAIRNDGQGLRNTFESKESFQSWNPGFRITNKLQNKQQSDTTLLNNTIIFDEINKENINRSSKNANNFKYPAGNSIFRTSRVQFNWDMKSIRTENNSSEISSLEKFGSKVRLPRRDVYTDQYEAAWPNYDSLQRPSYPQHATSSPGNSFGNLLPDKQQTNYPRTNSFSEGNTDTSYKSYGVQHTHFHGPDQSSSSFRQFSNEPKSLNWILEPPPRLVFSNSSGGRLDCQVDAGRNSHVTVTWIHNDGRLVNDVSNLFS